MLRLLPLNPGPDIATATAAVLADLSLGQVRGLLAGLARAHLIAAHQEAAAAFSEVGDQDAADEALQDAEHVRAGRWE